MSIYDNYMKVWAEKEKDMARPVVARVKDLKARNYSADDIAITLYNEGHNIDHIEAAIKSAFVISDNNPPTSYEDVKHIIQASVLTEHPRELISVLTANTSYGRIIPQDHSTHYNLEQFIAHCQINRNDQMTDELHKLLKPYVENMIVNMESLAKNKIKTASNERESEIINKWIDWLGIWTPMMYNSVRTNKFASQKIIEEKYDGESFTFCQKDKTEVSVDYGCIECECPFFQEIDGERVCNFIK